MSKTVSVPAEKALKFFGIDGRVEESLNEYIDDQVYDYANQVAVDVAEGFEFDDNSENLAFIDEANELARDFIWNNVKYPDILEMIADSLDGIISDINGVSGAGKQLNIYDEHDEERQTQLVKGEAIIGHGVENGELWFEIEQPFLVAYVEMAYCAHGFGDEGLTMNDMDGESVLAVMKWTSACLGNHGLGVDLDGYENRIKWPRNSEIEKHVEDVMNKKWNLGGDEAEVV